MVIYSCVFYKFIIIICRTDKKQTEVTGSPKDKPLIKSNKFFADPLHHYIRATEKSLLSLKLLQVLRLS